jgi:hypothetical protein
LVSGSSWSFHSQIPFNISLGRGWNCATKCNYTRQNLTFVGLISQNDWYPCLFHLW